MAPHFEVLLRPCLRAGVGSPSKHPERLQPPLLGKSGMLALELQRRVWDFIFLKGLHLLSSIVCTHVYVCVHVCVCVCIFFFIRTLCPQKDFLILLPFFCCEVCSPICPFRQSSCPVSLCRPSQARGTSLLLGNEDMGAKGGLHLVFQEFSHICPVDILR